MGFQRKELVHGKGKRHPSLGQAAMTDKHTSPWPETTELRAHRGSVGRQWVAGAAGEGALFASFIAQSTLGTAGFEDWDMQFCHHLGDETQGPDRSGPTLWLVVNSGARTEGPRRSESSSGFTAQLQFSPA